MRNAAVRVVNTVMSIYPEWQRSFARFLFTGGWSTTAEGARLLACTVPCDTDGQEDDDDDDVVGCR